MVLVAPRSAKLVEARGSRFTLLLGYVFCLLGFLTMLLLWDEGIPYWKVGARLRVRRHRRRLRRHAGLALADRLGAGAARRHGVGHRRPPARPRRRDHAVDPRRAADGRLRERASARQIAGSPNSDKVTDSVQSELTKSFSSAAATAEQYPQYSDQIIAGREDRVPAGRQLGLHARASSRSCSAPRSCGCASPARTRRSDSSPVLPRAGRRARRDARARLSDTAPVGDAQDLDRRTRHRRRDRRRSTSIGPKPGAFAGDAGRVRARRARGRAPGDRRLGVHARVVPVGQGRDLGGHAVRRRRGDDRRRRRRAPRGRPGLAAVHAGRLARDVARAHRRCARRS